MSKYYKLVRALSGGLKTSYIVGGEEKVQVKYKEGEWVEAQKWLADLGYHPLVFDSLKAVAKFCAFFVDSEEEAHQRLARWVKETRYFDLEIWECECESPIELPQLLDWAWPYLWFHHAESLEMLIKECRSTNWNLQETWPQGTKMFKRVKLTERLF